MSFRSTSILLLAMGALALPAAAQETDPAAVPAPPTTQDQALPAPAPVTQAELLDGLLGRLRLASSDDEAKLLEHGVWELWSRSGSPTADLLVEQAMKASNAGQTVKAIAILTTVIDDNPTYAEAWNKRATVYYTIGDYDHSLADIAKVLELEPRHFGALAGQGMIYNAQGKSADAIRSLKRALAINPHLEAAQKALKEIESDYERDI
jgi:tetratricopeptide (TPR) repeat protein